jgi:hypothetical protein
LSGKIFIENRACGGGRNPTGFEICGKIWRRQQIQAFAGFADEAG